MDLHHTSLVNVRDIFIAQIISLIPVFVNTFLYIDKNFE